MSLINKMLQDLDARGGEARSGALGAEIRAVPPAAAPRSRAGLFVVAAVVVAAAAAGATWWFARGVSTSVSSSAPLAATPRLVRQPDVRAPQRATLAAVAEVPQQVTPPEQTIDPAAIAAKVAQDARGGHGTASGRNGLVERRTETPARRETSAKTQKEKRVAAKPVAVRAVEKTATVASGGAVEASPQQRATALFERAQARLVDGRVGEAIANLESTLDIDPKHEAARQTLASLLVENGRYADAARYLQQGLAQDPRQTSMAMLLARLQLERGGPAIETLQTSLPYAQGNADYRALLAGVLQRAQRNKEAIDQYTAAVQLQPQQGVWWMGLGISLQSEQRNAEAKTAFTHARDSGKLSPELQGFVDRKLQQLSSN